MYLREEKQGYLATIRQVKCMMLRWEKLLKTGDGMQEKNQQ